MTKSFKKCYLYGSLTLLLTLVSFGISAPFAHAASPTEYTNTICTGPVVAAISGAAGAGTTNAGGGGLGGVSMNYGFAEDWGVYVFAANYDDAQPSFSGYFLPNTPTGWPADFVNNPQKYCVEANVYGNGQAGGSTVSLHSGQGTASVPADTGPSTIYDTTQHSTANAWLVPYIAPTGSFDGVSCTSAGGWALAQDEPNQSIDVDMYIDGTGISRTLANGSRPDVEAAYGTSYPNYGFNIPIPASYTDGNTHTVQLYDIDPQGVSNTYLGSRTFECAAPLPDLVPNPLPTLTATAGQPVTFSDRVVNQGTGATGAGFTDVFLPYNSAGTGNDLDVSNQALAAGATSAVKSATFTYPTAGTYTYAFCADDPPYWSGVIAEGSNEGNNCTTGTVNVGNAPAPDLTATTGAAINTTTGNTVTLTGTISNIGNASTGTSFYNEWQVALSDQATVEDNESSITGTLAAGASAGTSAQTSYTFPTAGTYYYRVCADINYAVNGQWSGNIQESNENNNCGGWQTINVAKTKIAPIGSFDGLVGCTDAGGWAAAPDEPNTSLNVDMYIDGADVSRTVANGSRPDVTSYLQGTYPNSGFSSSFSSYGFNIPIPASYTDGNTHTVQLYDIDPEGLSNTYLGSHTFQCAAPVADLITTTTPNYTVAVGQPLKVTGTFYNEGNGATSGTFPDLFVTNLNGSGTAWNTLQTVNNVVSQAAGATKNVSTTFPAGTFTTPGSYAWNACANINSAWQNVITESNYGNNCGPGGTITVTEPNLTAAAGPGVSIYTNTPTTLTGTISNTGNGDTGGAFNNELQVTQSDQATVVDNENVTISDLGPGASQAVSHATAYTFPTAGTYYYRYCADNNFAAGGGWTGSITESNENDNCSGWQTINVGNAPMPDLTANALSNLTAVAGSPVTFTGTAKNIGNASTGAGFTDAFLPNNGAGNGEVDVTNQVLAAGATGGAKTATYTYATPGTYTYAFCADWTNVIAESNEGNNCQTATVTVSAAPIPNITASTAGVTVTTTVNQPTTFSGTITNSGTGAIGYTPNIVQICDSACANINTAVAGTAYSSMAAGTSQSFTATYTPTLTTYQDQLFYRVCGDENTSQQIVNTESNYSDNCGAFQILNVNPPAPVTSISANPTSITQGQSTTVSWSATNNPTSCTLSNYGAVGASGSLAFSPNSTTTYTITCSNAGGSSASSVTVTVGAAPLPNITASTAGVTVTTTVNQPATFNGVITNSGSGAIGYTPNIVQICDGNCANVNTAVAGTAYGSMTPGSSQNFSATYTPTVTTTQDQLFYRVCGDENTAQNIVNTESNYSDNCGAFQVLNVNPPAPVTSISANPTSITQGQSTTVSWSATNNPTSCTLSNYGNVAASGSLAFSPNSNTTYTITCSNGGGSSASSVTVTVGAAPVPNITAATTAVTVTTTVNQPATFTGTITNNGTGSISNVPNIVEICDGNCANVNTAAAGTAYSSMAPNTTQSFTATYTPTVTSSQDQLYYRVCGDENTAQTIMNTESNYNDNCGAFQVLTVNAPLAADLTAGTGAPVATTPGATNSFSASIINNGTGPTSGGFWNLLQVCNDTNCSGYNSATNEGWVNTLAANSNAPVTVSAAVPGTAGSYVYRFCANNNTSWTNTVTESNYSNNCAAWATLTVANPTIGGSCSVSPTSGTTGTTYTWSASPTGGNGSYTYQWGGSVSGTANPQTMTYSTTGTYSGNVVVTSGGSSATLTCSPGSTTVVSCQPTLVANPSNIDAGQSTTLTWSENSSCASSCQISDGYSGGLTGSHVVTPPGNNPTATYAVTCGAYTTNTSLNVAVPTATISATPIRLSSGESTTVSWTASNVNACTITKNGVVDAALTPQVSGGSSNGSGSDVVTAQSVYVITCTSSGNSATAQVIVNVVPKLQEF